MHLFLWLRSPNWRSGRRRLGDIRYISTKRITCKDPPVHDSHVALKDQAQCIGGKSSFVATSADQRHHESSGVYPDYRGLQIHEHKAQDGPGTAL